MTPDKVKDQTYFLAGLSQHHTYLPGALSPARRPAIGMLPSAVRAGKARTPERTRAWPGWRGQALPGSSCWAACSRSSAVMGRPHSCRERWGDQLYCFVAPTTRPGPAVCLHGGGCTGKGALALLLGSLKRTCAFLKAVQREVMHVIVRVSQACHWSRCALSSALIQGWHMHRRARKERRLFGERTIPCAAA